MTTTPSALERARNSPRVQRVLRGMTRTAFFFTIISISATWTMAFPLVFLTGELDEARVVIYFLVPGAVWLII